jgi:VIT1/CCC1 family predicted Fe2+/Mn2+ transporter
VPVLPYLFGLQGTTALVVASVLVWIALLATGATVGLLSGGPPLRRALRQLLIGYGAAAVTYGLGLLFEATGDGNRLAHNPEGTPQVSPHRAESGSG